MAKRGSKKHTHRRNFSQQAQTYLPEDISVGDIYISIRTHEDGSQKQRPVLVTGIHYDAENRPIAFETFNMTTQPRSGSSWLNLSEKDLKGNKGNAGLNGNPNIDCSCAYIVAASDIKYNHGPIAKLPEKYLPDLLLRRMFSLILSKVPLFREKATAVSIESYAREGILFSQLDQSTLQADQAVPTDLPDCAHKFIDNELPDFNTLSHKDVDDITDWALAHIDKELSSAGSSFVSWPDKGSYPRWPNLKENMPSDEVTCTASSSASRKLEISDKKAAQYAAFSNLGI